MLDERVPPCRERGGGAAAVIVDAAAAVVGAAVIVDGAVIVDEELVGELLGLARWRFFSAARSLRQTRFQRFFTSLSLRPAVEGGGGGGVASSEFGLSWGWGWFARGGSSTLKYTGIYIDI